VLVFLPGQREIARRSALLEPVSREAGCEPLDVLPSTATCRSKQQSRVLLAPDRTAGAAWCWPPTSPNPR
jgi:HrpA-like RNA helicase